MKRLIAIVVLALALAGCGGSKYEFHPDVHNGKETHCGQVVQVDHATAGNVTGEHSVFYACEVKK